MTEPSDDTLVSRAAAGDRRAFAELLERHYDRIYRLGMRLLGDADAAADLAQDVCVGLPGKLVSFRGDSRFTTWLYRVVVNAARDAMRRAATRRRMENHYGEVEAMQRAPDAARQREAIWLRNSLARLSEDLRTTVVLVVGEGLGHAEAGRVLGVAESTVSWRMGEVRKRLRALAVDEETQS
ncbi:MAG: sigma-70 family RNA polymerase sigma factor [Gammaproteobacteria bacterium]|nr:sigma-70 family RNA polymerase sigma factor [Gammaproteobacteria bacterium]